MSKIPSLHLTKVTNTEGGPGMGLKLMRYRAILGGGLCFEARPGGGTRRVSVCRQPVFNELARSR